MEKTINSGNGEYRWNDVSVEPKPWDYNCYMCTVEKVHKRFFGFVKDTEIVMQICRYYNPGLGYKGNERAFEHIKHEWQNYNGGKLDGKVIKWYNKPLNFDGNYHPKKEYTEPLMPEVAEAIMSA